MYQGHLGAPWNVDVELFHQWLGAKHGDYRHPIHVVCNTLSIFNTIINPSLSLRGLETLEDVEELDGASRRFDGRRVEPVL